MSIIEYKNICMAYGEKTIIENFNLSIEKGEFVTIIGSSGCGKTTILKMVNGLVEPVSGEVLVEGNSTRQADLTMLRRHSDDGSECSAPQHRLCHPGKRAVSAYDGGEKYRLCAESAQQKR